MHIIETHSSVMHTVSINLNFKATYWELIVDALLFSVPSGTVNEEAVDEDSIVDYVCIV